MDRNDGREVIKASVPFELHAKFKAKCAMAGWNMSEVVTALVEKWTVGDKGAEKAVIEWKRIDNPK